MAVRVWVRAWVWVPVRQLFVRGMVRMKLLEILPLHMPAQWAVSLNCEAALAYFWRKII